MPVMPGMRMSSSTTDGFSLPTSDSASAPFEQTPATFAAGQLLDEPLQPLARRQLVVDDEHAQRCRVHSVYGKRTVTW